MAALFEVEVKGFEELKRMTAQINQSTSAQEALMQESRRLTQGLMALTASGFSALTQAVAANSAATTANTAAKQANIASAKKLAESWLVSLTPLKELNAQLTKQVATSGMIAGATRELTVSTNQHVAAVRNLLIADQKNLAVSGQISASYTKLAGLMAERQNLESGVTRTLSLRTAQEQALLAIERQKSAVEGIAIRNLQARIIAEANLTKAQKMRAMSELGIIDLVDKSGRATTRNIAATSNMAAATGRLAVTQRDLHSALRGVGAAMDSLFLTYGNIIPMLTAFLATMTGIQSLKVGAEFEAQARYIHELQDAADGAVISLGDIEKKLLDIKGVGRTPAELADGVKELVKAGIPAAEAIENIGYMAKFATVVETDMAKASELVTSQWLAWGPSSQAAGRGVESMEELMDLLAATTVKTKAGMEDLRVAVKYLTPLAGASKATYVELLALAGALSNIGLEGSMGTTAVRTGLMRLSAQAEQTAKRFAELQVNFNPYTDSTKTKLKQGLDMLKSFFVAVSKLKTESQQADMVFKVLGLRATQLSGLGLAMKGVASDAERLKEELEKVQEASRMKEGFVGTVFEKLSDTALFKVAEMKASIQRSMAEAFDNEEVKESFDRLLGTLESGAFQNLIATLSSGAASVIEAFTRMAAAGLETFSSVLEPLGKVLIAFYALRAATIAWNALLMMNPIIRGATLIGGSLIFLDSYLNKLKGVNNELRAQNALTGKATTPQLQRSHSASSSTASEFDFNTVLNPVNNAADQMVKGKLASSHSELNAVENKVERVSAKVTGLGLEAAETIETELGGITSGLGAVNLDALRSDIDRFLDRTGSASSNYTAKIQNEVDGYIEKAKKLAIQNKTSIDSVMSSLGTSEAEIRSAGEALIVAFNTEQTEKFNKSIRDIVVDLEALSGKTGSTDKFEIGMARVTKTADELKNRIKDLANEMVKQGVATDYADALAKIAKEGKLAGGSIEAVAKAAEDAKKVLAASIVDDYSDSFRKLTSSTIYQTKEQKILNSMTEKYDKQLEELKKSRGAIEETGGVEAYNTEMQKLIALQEYELQNNTELLKSSENLWSGFQAGVIEAQNEMKTLGELGNEIFKDLQGGVKTTFVDLLKGDTSKIGENFSNAGKAMGDHVIDYAADRLTGAAMNFAFGEGSAIGGLMDSIGLGGMFSPTPKGTKSSPLWVRNADGVFGNGFSGAGAQGWVNPDGMASMFGPGITSAFQTGIAALGTAAGAYGMYSGIKQMKAGNTGMGALQTGLGAVSAYQGAVGLGIIEKGAATAAAKWAAGKVGLGKATEVAAAKTAETVATKVAAAKVAETAATKTVVGGTTKAVAAKTAATPAWAAGATYAVIAAAVALAAKGIYDKSKRPSASAEIDEAGVTSDSIKAFNNEFRSMEGSILKTVPTLAKYSEAMYDTETQVLTMQNGVKQLKLQYDASAQAGHQWSSEITGGTSILTSSAAKIIGAFAPLPLTVAQIHEATNLATNAASQLAGGSELAQRSMNQLDGHLRGLGMSEEQAATATQQLVGNVDMASASLSHLSVTTDVFSNNANGASVTADELARRTAELNNKLGEAAGGANKLTSSVDEFSDNANGSASSVRTLAGQVVDLAESSLSAAGAIRGSAGEIRAAFRDLESQSSENFSSHIIGGSGQPEFHAAGGVLRGGSHSRDDLYLGTINGRDQVAMGGEYIMPQDQTQKYLPILDAMRRDRYAGGGRIGFAEGGELESIREQATTSIFDATHKDYEISLRNLQLEYDKTSAKVAELGGSAEDAALVTEAWNYAVRDAKDSWIKGIKDIMIPVETAIAQFFMTDQQKALHDTTVNSRKLVESLTEAGASAAAIAKVWKLDALQKQKITWDELKPSIDTLKSFRESLAGTTETLTSSKVAQNKLLNTLEAAKKGNFSGVSGIGDVIKDISLNKADYATAYDYAKDYWRTMAAVSQLEKLVGRFTHTPGYASGGDFAGGLRVVGETGPEIEYTGPSRIYNRDQLIDLTAVLEELRSLRQAVNAGNFAIAKNTQKTAESLTRVEYDGLSFDAGTL